MGRRRATANDLQRFETKVDGTFAAALPLADNATVLAWQLIGTVEDFLRQIIIDPHHQTKFNLISRIDGAKYALKHALSAIFGGRHPGVLPIPVPDLLEAPYTAAIRYFVASQEYHVASVAFSMLHAGAATNKMRGNRLTIIPRYADRLLLVRELVESVTGPTDAPTSLLFELLAQDGSNSSIVQRIREGAKRLSDSVIEFRRDARIVSELRERMPAPINVLPQQWSWNGCTTTELHRVLHALQAICLHHVVANFWAGTEIAGMNLSTAALVIDCDTFEALLSQVSCVQRATVSKICSVLVYGMRAKSPDPTLQPLIRASSTHLLIPALLTVSNAVERNFLTLIARIDERSFNAVSHTFETAMISDICRVLSTLPYGYRANLFVPSRRDAGEVDLLIMSEPERLVLVCELRWMLRPGEIREMLNRRDSVPAKVLQAKTKASAIREQLRDVVRSMNVSVKDPSEWRVQPVVVLDGVAGGSEQDVPVVTRRVFEDALAGSECLSAVLRGLTSDLLQPIEGVHFRNVPVVLRYGDVELEYAGVELLPRAAELAGEPGSVFSL